MDFGYGGSAGDSFGGDKGQGFQGSEGLKRKWSDLDASMKAMKDEVVKENAEMSSKIRRLMQEIIRLEQDNGRLQQTVLRLENPTFQEPIRELSCSDPFDVFPKEVWEMIIERVNRSTDLEMLCIAFPQLEPLVMKRKKTIFLFENVLPFLCHHLDWKAIKNCRLVCEKWNRDLCAFLANQNSPNLLFKPHKTSAPYYPIVNSLRHAYTFESSSKIQLFLTRMAEHPRNPFFGRYVRLCVIDELALFWKSVLQLVETFGEHIWILKIKCLWGSYDATAFYKTLRETLVHLPCLRHLTVALKFTSQGRNKSNLDAQLGSCPLPPLPYLQSFKLEWYGEMGIIRAFSALFSQQIFHLKLVGETFGSVHLTDEWLRGLVNLEDLVVNLKSTEDILKILKFPSRNLKKLSIYSDHFQASLPLPSDAIVTVLEKFPQLEHSNILHWSLERSCSSNLGIQFSRLRTLKIVVRVHVDDLQYNLDFLLWFPCLKYLVIDDIHTDDIDLDEDEMDKHSSLKIRNHLFTDEMLESNIWELIPSLEVLEVWLPYTKYTREMFENRRG